MFKKIILASAIAAVSTGVVMANPAPYIGAGLGVVANTSSSLGNYRGVPVNLFAGYGGVITDAFYLAGELNGTVGTVNLNDNGLRTSYGYGASVIPGVMLSDHTMAFARAGIVRARFPQQSQNSTGGQLGLGMQTSLTQHVDLRGEYDFVAYRSVNQTIAGTSVSSKPRSDQFNLGLVYKFD